MKRKSILFFIERLKREVFTTRELSDVSGKSLSTTVQALNFLQKQNIVFKIYRGIWAKTSDRPLSPYRVISFLPLQNRSYLSFTSALHLYGIIEQIPQIITLASLGHTRKFSTRAGVFSLYQIKPSFFKGFDWYKENGSFLIAEPEKALVDCLYISACKKNQFNYFPELNFPKSFSFKKAKNWIRKIKNPRIAVYAEKKLYKIRGQQQ